MSSGIEKRFHRAEKLRNVVTGVMRYGLHLRGVLLLLVTAVFACTSPSVAEERVEVKVVAVITAGEFIDRLKVPGGLFFDETKKRLYIADSGNGRLISFDSEFQYLAELSHDAFSLPLGLVKDKSGRFFVIDGARQEVLFVDMEREIIEPIFFKGVPQGKERFVPGRMTIDSAGRLYIIDRLNRRLVVVESTGEFIREITSKDKGFFGFNDVRVDDGGNIYAVDTLGKKVYVFDVEGSVTSSFFGNDNLRFPASLAVHKNGFIYVADTHGDSIKVYDKDGILQYTISESGTKEGELTHPSYLFIDKEGRIYVIDGNRVQVFVEQKE
jgi:sugar lactone lactonase YvrE